MKKRFQIVLTLLIMTIALSGCCMQHEWKDATCEEAKTCVKCGKTVGEALGHDWQTGNCLTPKTCKRCGYAEGEAPGHIWMKETCQTPRTCSVCGAVEGEVADHTWIAATCLRPKYCSVCGLTEGTTVAHQWVEANYNSPRTCAICGATEGTALATYESSNNNFNYSLATGSEQNYSTITGYDNRIANGTVTVLSYNKYTSDSTHAAREGYEWREIKVKFSMDKACRVMWGYTDIYSGLSEYAKTNYITYADGTREKVEATQSFSTEIVTPAITGGTTPSPTPTTEPTPSPTPSPTAAATASATGAAASPSPVTAPQITPSPTPTPVPTPESEPGKYVSYVTQAVQVPIKYDGLVFYVCNADYESDHRVDDTFQFMKMN